MATKEPYEEWSVIDGESSGSCHLVELRSGNARVRGFIWELSNGEYKVGDVYFSDLDGAMDSMRGQLAVKLGDAVAADGIVARLWLGASRDRLRSRPPRAGEFIIGRFCRRNLREAVLGDLAEQYEVRMAAKGNRAATRWYWWQVIRSSSAFAVRWGRRLLELEGILNRIGF